MAARRAAERPRGSARKRAEVLAYRWRGGRLEPIRHPDVYPLDGLIGVERSVARLRANVSAFTRGEPALDALLYGERGTGKSSAVRGLLGEFGASGFRLVEVRRNALLELSEIWAVLRGRPERFAVFCDDLSFEEGDASWKQLKAELDGGLEARPANALVIATSNRRHLVPERMSENREAALDRDGLLHPGETAEEKVSLSDRFGLLLPFFAFDQETYLRIVRYHARTLGLEGRSSSPEFERAALRFALERGTRSGRTARQACIAASQSLAEREP
ncbi:MAG: ATP-binding protein [Myxococcota bacterium]